MLLKLGKGAGGVKGASEELGQPLINPKERKGIMPGWGNLQNPSRRRAQ